MKSTYNQKTYILPMTSEIVGAKVYIGYLTPFLSKTAIDLWAGLIRKKIKEGVRIDIFVEQPEDWDWDLDPRDAVERDWLKTNIKRLEEMGCHVTLVKNFHEKALIIDYQVLWSGSINFLSSDPEKRSEKVDRDDDFLAVTNAYFRFNFERCCVCEKIQWKKIRGAKVIDLKSVSAKSHLVSADKDNGAVPMTVGLHKLISVQQEQEQKRNGDQQVPVDPERIPDVDEEPLGKWVSAIRRSFKISINKISKVTGVSRSSLLQFEAGSTIPTLRLLVAFLDVLGYELLIVPKRTESIHRRIAKGFRRSLIAKAISRKSKSTSKSP